MATVNQIYELVNAVSQEAFGDTSLVAHDLQGLIAMGQDLSDFGEGTRSDVFLRTLVDRIARTVVRKLDMPIEFKSIMTDSFTYGCVLQKLSVDVLEASAYEPSLIGGVSYTPNQFAIHKPTIHQSFFEGSDAWSVKVTMPDDLYSSAFNSPTDMANFIDSITSSLVDSMTLKINDVNRLCVDNFIGEKIYSNRNVVHLLTEYNTLFNPSTNLTIDTAMVSPEFFRYTSKRMNDIMRYMARPSKIFNEGGLVRTTIRDNMHVFLLGEFASNFKTYLQSDTFWKDLVELPLFSEVSFWQSMVGTHTVNNEAVVNTMPDFVTASTIKLAKLSSSTSETTKAVNKAGIIGAFIDRQALGSTVVRKVTSIDRNNDAEYSNMSAKAKMGYYNDLSENGCIFVMD